MPSNIASSDWQDVAVSPLPQHCPTPRELDDLELLTNGALAPLSAFNTPGSPVTLTLPEALANADEVELVDPEGLPLAVVVPTTGEVRGLTHGQHGPFRRLHLSPSESQQRHPGALVVPVTGPLTAQDLSAINARRAGGPVVLLALAGHGTPENLSPVGLIRATVAAAELLGAHADVVVAPLASHDDPDADHALGQQVVATYAGDCDVLALPDIEGDLPDEIAAIVDAERPAPDEQGLVVFFTGLSGSGKSTLAQALMDLILEQGVRTVTSLDGDVVRRNLSAGLTFSKEDRETNIRRIGWVAAEIARHGGLAVCSPIAPFAATRADVREYIESASGAFFLVHVATPLEECERRDRKGLYAKARRGEIPEFTGISSPYEEPDDAAVRVDTTGRSIEDALDDVLAALAEAGYLDLGRSSEVETSEPETTPTRRSSEAETSEPETTPTRRSSEVETTPLRALFVCTANICRSAWLEQAARAYGAEGVDFTSAGTMGLADHPMDETMAGELSTPDYAFRSRRVTARMLDEADVILTAERTHRSLILEEHPQLVRKVFTLGQFARAVAEHPELRGRELLIAAGEHRTQPMAEDDIADPYRRGTQAATDAAGKMSEMLSAIVPALAKEQ